MQRKEDVKTSESMKEKVERRTLNELNMTLKESLVYCSMCPNAFVPVRTNNIMRL